MCALARMLAQTNDDIDFTPEEAGMSALIMNIGETSEVDKEKKEDVPNI